MIVSCQLRMSIAMNAEITVTVLPSTLETVFVSTLATPPTSFCSRDWMTPVFVRVKKLSSMACRCVKSRTRRVPMTLLPMLAVSQVCHTPSSADTMNTAIIASTSVVSTGMFGPDVAPLASTGKSPSSNARWVSSGGITLSAAPMSTSTTVVMSATLCAVNSSAMRPSRFGIFGASAFSARCAASSADAMRVRPLPYRPVCPPGAPPCMLMRTSLSGGYDATAVAGRPRGAFAERVIPGVPTAELTFSSLRRSRYTIWVDGLWEAIPLGRSRPSSATAGTSSPSRR